MGKAEVRDSRLWNPSLSVRSSGLLGVARLDSPIVESHTGKRPEHSFAKTDPVFTTRNRAVVLHLDQDGATVADGNGLGSEIEPEQEV
jgi:hypothetical protein